MDIHSATWQVAVEAAGIWPSVVILGANKSVFVLSYHRSDGEDRVLIVNGRTCAFSDIEALNDFLIGPHADTPEDVHLALEVLSALSPQGLPVGHFPRILVEQAIYWIAGGRMLAGEGQVQRLLDTLAFVNEWHESLEESGIVGAWPEALDDAAELLSDVVVTHQITSMEAGERLATMDLRRVLAEEVAELMRWSG